MSIDLTIRKARTIRADDEQVSAEYSLTARNLEPGEIDACRVTLESKVDTWLSELKAPTPTPMPAAPQIPAQPAAPSPFDPKTLFPEGLRELLTFEQTASGWKIKPRQFLGSENFAKIADVVRGAGGQYISAGKESHFVIPRGGSSGGAL